MKKISARACLAVTLICLVTAALRVQAVELNAAAQKRLGVRVEALRMATVATTLDGVAQVLDPVPLMRLNSDLAVAGAAAAASGADAERLAKLHDDDGNVSLRALEAARATAAGDAAKLSALRAELRGSWGSALAALTAQARGQLMDALASGGTVLLRVETLAITATAPRVAQLVMADRSARRVEILGPLPQAGSGAGAAWLGRTGGVGLGVGMARPVKIESTGRQSGVHIPRNAIVRWNGLNWVYVAAPENHFERRALTGGQARADGWLAPAGFEAGENVVVQGAASLLAAETLAGKEEAPEKEAE